MGVRCMINKIAFIGAGSMAEAIIAGIINKNVIKSEQIFVTNKNNEDQLMSLEEQYHVKCMNNKEMVVNDADIIVLSMKPNDVKEAVESIQDFLMPEQLIISVVAGVSTSLIAQLIQKHVPIIRAMPNTSASIGYSATALTSGQQATKSHLAIAETLFNTIGMTVRVDEE